MYKNYNSLSAGRDTWLKNGIGGDVGSPPISSWIKRSWCICLFLIMCLFSGTSMMAQSPATYSLGVSSGTYTPITLVGGATSPGAFSDDTVRNIPGLAGFTINGVTYTNYQMNDNGRLSLYVTTAPTAGGTYTPLSSAITNAAVVFAPYGADLFASSVATSEYMYQLVGDELVFQWQNVSRYNLSLPNDILNFQVRLNTLTGEIKYVYGTNTIGSGPTGLPQVGFRTSTTWAADVNNLALNITGSPVSCDWSNAVTANSNAASMYQGVANPSVKALSGLTYTWTKQTSLPYLSPVRVFTATTAIATTGATVNWTAPANATQYDVQYRAVGSCAWTDWASNPVMTNTVSLTGLAANTSYQVRVRSSNGTINAVYSHSPNAAGGGDGYVAAGSFTTLANPCAGTPTPGTVPASTNICSGATSGVAIAATGYTTGVTGISFQWEESDDNGVGDPWANTVGGSGATTATYTTPVLAVTRYYRMRITCANGAGTDVTNVSTVNVVSCSFDVARNTGVAYTSIIPTGTSMTWNTAASTPAVDPTWLTDENTSIATPFPFPFVYRGNTVSQFRVSTNGFVTLSNAALVSQSGFTQELGSTTNWKSVIAPFWEDLVTQGNPNTVATLNGASSPIRYQVDGVMPNRVLTIEWSGMEVFSNPGPNLNFQAKFHEGSNVIDFVYGNMEGFNGTLNTTFSYAAGINGETIGTANANTLNSQNIANTRSISSTTASNALAIVPECNSSIVFTPGTYTAYVPGAATPANDNPAGAIGLVVNNAPCTSLCGTYYTSIGATATPGITVCGAGTPGQPDDDVWFTFVATSPDTNINVYGGGGYNPVVQLFSDAGTTSLFCSNATAAGLTETINATGLSVGVTYYVRVYHQAAGNGTAQTFSICVSEVVLPPVNDDPCGAVTLTPSVGCTPYNDTTFNSTTKIISATTTAVNGVVTPICAGAGATVRDVWFKFTATSTTHGVTLTPVPGFDIAVEGFEAASGTCGGADLLLTSLGCVNGASTGGIEQVVFSTVATQDYYLRVYRHPSGISGTPVSNSQFSLCVFNPVPPCTTNTTPINNATSVSLTPTLTWAAAPYATNYDIYLGTISGPVTLLQNVVGVTTYTLTSLQGLMGNTEYFWYIVPKNLNGDAVCGAADETSFTTVSCGVPTAIIQVAPITEDAITVSWDASPSMPADGYQYELRTSGAAGSGATGLQASGTTASLTVSFMALPNNTTYSFYLRSVCSLVGNDFSVWTAATQLRTGYCTPAPTSVDGSGITNVTFGNINNTTAAEVGNYGNYSAMITDVIESTSIPVSITYATGFTYDTKIWVDWNDDFDFDDVGEEVYVGTSLATNPTTLAASFNVPAAAYGNHRLRIGGQDIGPATACYAGSFGAFEDYTINVIPVPTCFGPTSLVTSAITNNSATVSWTASVSAPTGGYDYYYDDVNTAPDEFTVPSGSVADPIVTVDLTGLTGSTTYYVWVRSNCGAGDFSNWVSTSFVTLCDSVVAPWTETFSATIPTCWSQGVGNAEPWLFANSNGGNHIGDGSGTIAGTTPSGGFFAWVDDSTPSSLATSLLSPFIDITPLTVPELSFYLVSDNEGFTNVAFSVDVWDGDSWNLGVFTSNTDTAAGAWQKITVDLSVLTIVGDIQLRFVVNETNGTDFYDDIAIDDVSVHEAPSCIEPTNVIVTGYTTTTADFSWTASVSAPADGYDYYFNSTGVAPTGVTTPTGSVAAGVLNSNLSLLTADTTYYIWVRSNCGLGNLSAWSTPASFFTGYCQPSPSSVDGLGITNVTFSSVNNSTVDEVDNYGNYSAMIGNVQQSATLSVDITYETGFTYDTAIWVDWNNDLDFNDVGELVYTGVSTDDDPTTLAAGFVVPLATPLGTYRMRIGGQDVGPVDACYTGTYGTFEDYTINVTPAPSCITPAGLGVSSLTLTSATVSWSAAGSPLAYEYEVRSSGAAGSGLTGLAASNSVPGLSDSVTGLIASTSYSLYVRSDCGAGDFSAWSPAFVFYTGYCIPAPTLVDDLGITRVAFSNVSNVTADEPGNYGDYSAIIGNVQQGDLVPVAIRYETGFTYDTKIWIDWNNDLDFDDVGENVYTGVSTSASPTTLNATFTVPMATPLGNYRMRIGGQDVGPAVPCFDEDYGTFEDYTIQVLAPCSLSTTWTAGAWSNGVPTASYQAIISSNFTSTANLSACSLTVNNSAVVTVNTGHDFNIGGDVTVAVGASLTFENNANLLQDPLATANNNSGNIVSKRSATMRRLDYVYWGSPVSGQDLKVFSPYTVSPTNVQDIPTPVGLSRFYTLNETNNSFAVIAEPLGVNFDAAKGYMLRAPNNFPSNGSPSTFNGAFRGVPHNGDYSIAITNTPVTGSGFNMLGNPYPSPINATQFLATNPGTLYFWTHQTQDGTSSSYSTFNEMGATNPANGPLAPNGFIQTGQGFLLQTAASGTASFTNAMRSGDNQGQFFRTENVEKHRFWLSLSKADVPMINQILVGYMQGATQGFDVSVDGLLNHTGNSIASTIGDGRYAIQGRSLPFNASDVVPMAFKAEAEGTYTISLDQFDGLFEGDQTIFIKDNLTGAEQNLKTGAYSFATIAGSFSDRFQIIFQTTLGVENPGLDANTIVVYKDNGMFHINAGTTTMSSVKVFDIRGRMIYEKDGINATTTSLNNMRAEQQVLLVQITSDTNKVVTKKVIN